MSNIFSNKKTAKGAGVETDYVPSGGVFETDIYDATIKHAYLQKSQSSDSMSLNFIFNIGDKELKSRVTMSNRQGDVTYIDKKTKEEKNLPGYSQINSASILLLGTEVGDLEVEDMKVKIWDNTAKKELPQSVDCFTEFHGVECQIAVQKQLVDKTALNKSTNIYEPTGDTREENEVIKFFPAGKTVTLSEVVQYVESLGGSLDDILDNTQMNKAISKMPEDMAVYGDTWLTSNKGKTRDKTSGKTAKEEGKSFSDTKAKSKSKTSTNLFDDE